MSSVERSVRFGVTGGQWATGYQGDLRIISQGLWENAQLKGFGEGGWRFIRRRRDLRAWRVMLARNLQTVVVMNTPLRAGEHLVLRRWPGTGGSPIHS